MQHAGRGRSFASIIGTGGTCLGRNAPECALPTLRRPYVLTGR